LGGPNVGLMTLSVSSLAGGERLLTLPCCPSLQTTKGPPQADAAPAM
jgi:hypothetical protein